MRFSIIIGILLFFSIDPINAQTEDFIGIDFSKADSVARIHSGHPLSNLKGLADSLTNPFSTDVEKFRSIYTWVCLNIENDYNLFTRNQQKRKKLKNKEALASWNAKLHDMVFKNLIEKKRTVCTGYALLIKKLANYAGIDCEIVDGYGRTAQANIGGHGVANHSWNGVTLNGKRYLCDATWSSGAVDTEKKVFIPHYNDIYFLLDPALFIRNHYPLDTTWTLLKNPPTLQQFLTRPLIYNSIFPYRITTITPEIFAITTERQKQIEFHFTSSVIPVNKIGFIIVEPTGPRSISPSIQPVSDELLSFSHTFTKKGSYDVHILFNDQHVITYNVKVR